MSIQLILLSGFMIMMTLLTVVKPVYVFEYPVAACTLITVFMLPQAWQIERTGDLADFDPSTTWNYMILCMAATVVGYVVGKSRKAKPSAMRQPTLVRDFDIKRLLVCTLILWLIGGIAVILMIRQAATMAAGTAWTGQIAFYAMLTNLFLYATVVCWVAYLHLKSRWFLILSVIGLITLSGQFFYSARREGSFILGVTIILGIYFVKGRMISRLFLIPLLMIGGLLINQAGAIRGYIAQNNSTIIGALSSEEIISKGIDTEATEVSSAVSDIYIANLSGQYRFLSPLYNQIVNLYVPAFILGRQFKDGLLINVDEDVNVSRYYANGSTRTGFADTFQSLHYFGAIIFFAVAYAMGLLWKRAIRGDLLGQIFYMIMLAGALKVVTESASSFFGVLPLLFGSVGIVLYVARKRISQDDGGRWTISETGHGAAGQASPAA